MIDTAVRISLLHEGVEVDYLAAQSAEGAVELTVEMLRRAKRLHPGDMVVVERLVDYIGRHSPETGLEREYWRKESQI